MQSVAWSAGHPREMCMLCILLPGGGTITYTVFADVHLYMLSGTNWEYTPSISSILCISPELVQLTGSYSGISLIHQPNMCSLYPMCLTTWP